MKENINLTIVDNDKATEESNISEQMKKILVNFNWIFLEKKQPITGAYYIIEERVLVSNESGVKILIEKYPGITDIEPGYYVTKIITKNKTHEVCSNIKDFKDNYLYYLTESGEANLLNHLNQRLQKIVDIFISKGFHSSLMNEIEDIKDKRLISILDSHNNKVFYLDLFITDGYDFYFILNNSSVFSTVTHYDKINQNKGLTNEEYIYYLIDINDSHLKVYNKINSFIKHFNGQYGFLENDIWYNNLKITKLLLKTINNLENYDNMEIVPNYEMSSSKHRINLLKGQEIYRAFSLIVESSSKHMNFNISVDYNTKRDPFSILLTIKSDFLDNLLELNNSEIKTYQIEFDSVLSLLEFLKYKFIKLSSIASKSSEKEAAL